MFCTKFDDKIICRTDDHGAGGPLLISFVEWNKKYNEGFNNTQDPKYNITLTFWGKLKKKIISLTYNLYHV